MSELLVIAPSSLVGSRFVNMGSEWSKIDGAGTSVLTETTSLANYYQIDITDPNSIDLVFRKTRAEWVINFAGFTDVAKAEESRPVNCNDLDELERNLPYRLNVMGVANLLEACKNYNKKAIFISSDFVFDGLKGPYSEDDQMAKEQRDVSWYGWTKRMADQAIIEDGRSTIIRIAYPYRKQFIRKGDVVRNFLKFYDRFEKGEVESLYPVFNDQMFTPTFIDDLSPVIKLLIDRDQKGLFHVASGELVSFYDFVCGILSVAKGVNEPEKVVPEGSIYSYFEQNPTKAKWPIAGGLKIDKIAKLGFVPTDWREGLKKVFNND